LRCIFRILARRSVILREILLVFPPHVAMFCAITYKIAADAKEICEKGKIWLKRGSMPPHTHERLLHDIVRGVYIAKSVEHIPKKHRLILLEQKSKRFHIGSAYAFKKMFVGVGHGELLVGTLSRQIAQPMRNTSVGTGVPTNSQS
jgi:hypothetical protein